MPRLIFLTCLALLVACQQTDFTKPQAVINQSVEFRLLLEPDAPGSSLYFYGGKQHSLGEASPFALGHVYAATDDLGNPALGFLIAPEDQAGFGDWTGEHVAKQLAVLIDGEVLTMPKISERLPGRGIINGGAGGFTTKEVAEFLETLTQ